MAEVNKNVQNQQENSRVLQIKGMQLASDIMPIPERSFIGSRGATCRA
jgi:hypothetical protein